MNTQEPALLDLKNVTVMRGEKIVLENFSLRPEGSLQDISPTVLGMLGFSQPKDMTGRDLRVLKT